MAEDKYSSQKRYQEKIGMFKITIPLSPKTEQDIIDAIFSQGKGKQSAYIKRLIREDIERSKKN